MPDDVRSRSPEVPWAQIVGTRHILAHHYARTDNKILWRLLTGPLEDLEAKLMPLLADKLMPLLADEK